MGRRGNLISGFVLAAPRGERPPGGVGPLRFAPPGTDPPPPSIAVAGDGHWLGEEDHGRRDAASG